MEVRFTRCSRRYPRRLYVWKLLGEVSRTRQDESLVRAQTNLASNASSYCPIKAPCLLSARGSEQPEERGKIANRCTNAQA
jgi:hypothetical protein